MSQTDVRLLVERYRAGWFGHDVDAIMAVVGDDIVFHNVTTAERVEGAAAFREHVAGIHERWPDLGFDEVARVAAPLKVAAVSADGVVEGLELQPNAEGWLPFLLSVQFHPERLVDRHPEHQAIFRAFTRVCAQSRKKL